jgi:hypothetical protein
MNKQYDIANELCVRLPLFLAANNTLLIDGIDTKACIAELNQQIADGLLNPYGFGT